MPTLVIQMGHVGRPPCPGSQGTTGEQTFTQRAGAACQRLLNGQGGWTVKLIDADPGYDSPTAPFGGDPNQYRGDAFVAVHCDGSSNPDRNGASFGFRAAGRAFAQDIKGAYLLRTERDASWLEPDNYTSNLAGYYGNNLATSVGNTRAVIFETGFLTNPQDRDMLLAPTGPDNVAYAIGDALGITAKETTIMGDMDWGDPLNPLPGALEPYPLSAAAVIRGAYDLGGWNGRDISAANNKLTALGPPTARIEAKVDQLLALHGGATSFDDAMAKVREASAEAARQGAREAITADVQQRLLELQALLQQDNAEQAKATARELLSALREALPS